jgi:xylan 1,4-beta-xylosidase
MLFTNPVIAGFHPDPSICRVGEDYYLVNSSFEYYPGIPIFHSRDLVHWRQLGHCLNRASQLDLRTARVSGGIFAPTIRHHRGIFYVITTHVDAGKHLIVTASDPAGPWSEPIWIDLPGYDPSLYFLDDGSALLTCSQQIESNTAEGNTANSHLTIAIAQCEIDVRTGAVLSPVRHIWFGTGGKYPEGPHLYRVADHYYLLIAEGGTEYGHMVTIARSATPWGPFTSCPRNPILSHRSTDHVIQGTGHADLVQAHDGNWWMVCLGFRPVGYPPCYHLGRETFLAPISWENDGWPVIGHGGHVDVAMEAPAFLGEPWPEPAARDDFAEPALRHSWNMIRTPHTDDWSLTARSGWLRLVCMPMTLDDPLPAFVGRRQEHFDCVARTLVEFVPQQEDDEAGLTVFMNPHHHYELAIVAQAAGRALIVRRRIGTLSAIVASRALPDGPVILEIAATPAMYTFRWSTPEGEREALAQGETRYLATEVAGGFTGVYFGLYATAHHQESHTVVDFDWFEYHN